MKRNIVASFNNIKNDNIKMASFMAYMHRQQRNLKQHPINLDTNRKVLLSRFPNLQDGQVTSKPVSSGNEDIIGLMASNNLFFTEYEPYFLNSFLAIAIDMENPMNSFGGYFPNFYAKFLLMEDPGFGKFIEFKVSSNKVSDYYYEWFGRHIYKPKKNHVLCPGDKDNWYCPLCLVVKPTAHHIDDCMKSAAQDFTHGIYRHNGLPGTSLFVSDYFRCLVWKDGKLVHGDVRANANAFYLPMARYWLWSVASNDFLGGFANLPLFNQGKVDLDIRTNSISCQSCLPGTGIQLSGTKILCHRCHVNFGFKHDSLRDLVFHLYGISIVDHDHVNHSIGSKVNHNHECEKCGILYSHTHTIKTKQQSMIIQPSLLCDKCMADCLEQQRIQQQTSQLRIAQDREEFDSKLDVIVIAKHKQFAQDESRRQRDCMFGYLIQLKLHRKIQHQKYLDFRRHEAIAQINHVYPFVNKDKQLPEYEHHSCCHRPCRDYQCNLVNNCDTTDNTHHNQQHTTITPEDPLFSSLRVHYDNG